MCELFGLAQKYLNKPSKTLSYLTEGIFPYYILHQTIIVIIGANLTTLVIGAIPEFLILMALTPLLCLGIYDYIIRRTPFLRPLFGLKFLPPKKQMIILEA